MKIRLLSGFLAASMLLTFTPTLGAAAHRALYSYQQTTQEERIQIDSLKFPDEVFRNWLLNPANLNGAGVDGALTRQELAQITHIDVSGQGIQSLKGLEVFFALRELNCSRNRLTELDVSANMELIRLYAGYNQLESLSLENHPKLESLSFNHNRLQELDVLNTPSLKWMNGEMNRLTQLELSESPALEWLSVVNNQLTAIDLSGNINLSYLALFDNQLKALDINNLSELTFLDVSYNYLTALDLSQNNSIDPNTSLWATENYLEEITLPVRDGAAVSAHRYQEQHPVTRYDRVEWYYDAGFTRPVHGAVEANGQTLYSKRIANEYQIHFSGNDGNGSMPVLTAVYDQPVTLPPAQFTRYGHTFEQWDTVSRGGGDTFADEQTIFNLSGKGNGDRITLYAQWKPIQYSIAFDANHASATGDMEEISAVFGQEIQLPVNTFAVDGLEFVGWARSADGPVRYRDVSEVYNLSTIADETVTLYAIWRTPIAQVQQPYLDKLNQAFSSYVSKDYTEQDWTELTDIYTSADSAIRSSSVVEHMEQYSNQGIEDMDGIKTRASRRQEILDGWRTKHAQVIGILSKHVLTESNYAEYAAQAREACSDLTAERLAAYSGLAGAEDLEAVAGAAAEELAPTAEELTALLEAAHWLTGLEGLSLLPAEQATSEKLNQYRAALEGYEKLNNAAKAQLAPQVRTQLENRKELADQKRSAAAQLHVSYQEMGLGQASEQVQQAVLNAFKQGIDAIERAGSVQEVQTAMEEGRQAMLYALVVPEPPVTPSPSPTPTPPGTGGGSTGGGGGSVITSYQIRVETAEHGVVTADAAKAVKGETITLQAAANPGYELESLSVTESSGKAVPTTAQEDGRITFVMPAANVIVRAAFRALETPWENPFTDVAEEAWFYGPIQYVAQNNLFAGMGDGQFQPDGSMTRAMLVTVLYRAAGEPEISIPEASFDDVAPESWYGPAVYWAKQQGITAGASESSFEPETSITREQLAAMLHRFAGTPAAEGLLAGFVDADEMEDFAADALGWAVAHGIIKGQGGGILAPKGIATRAQVAQMLMNFIELEK